MHTVAVRSVCLMTALSSVARGQSGVPVWADQFFHTGLSDGILQACTHDFDGDGPEPAQLVVTGGFTSAGDTALRYLARWSGERWLPVAGGLPAPAMSLASFDEDGNGPVPPKLAATYLAPSGDCELAILDGTQWRVVMDGVISTAVVFGVRAPGPGGASLYFGAWGKLFAYSGGQFTVIAESEPGYEHESPVWGLVLADMTESGGGTRDLVAAGIVSPLSGPATGFARWDGEAWHPACAGLQGGSHDMLVHDSDGAGALPERIYVVGMYYPPGPMPESAVAAWNGSSWDYLLSLDAAGRSAVSIDSDGGGPAPSELFVLGSFWQTGVGEFNIARLSGSEWQAVPGALDIEPNGILALDADGNGPNSASVLAFGRFNSTRPNHSTFIPEVALLNESGWLPLGTPTSLGVSGEVWCMTSHDPDGPGPQLPYLVLGGDIGLTGVEAKNYVVKFDGTAFSAVGGNLTYIPNSLESYDPDDGGPLLPRLFAAGIPTQSSARFAELQAGVWVPVPAPLSTSHLRQRRMHGTPVLLSWAWSGQFHALQGSTWTSYSPSWAVAVKDVARFDPDGSGPLVEQFVVAGRPHDPAFGPIATGPYNWAPIAAGMSNSVTDRVECLAVYDEDGTGPNPPRLFAGGSFRLGANPPTLVARWDGIQWTSLLSGYGSDAEYMLVLDIDGPGPEREELYVSELNVWAPGGALVGGGVVRWNGDRWRGLGAAVPYYVGSMISHDEDGSGPATPALFVGGRFFSVGGYPSLNIARWGLESGCYANCDSSTTPPILNVADFTCFLQQFVAGRPRANCDESLSGLNVADFTCFLQRFAQGCP